MKKLIFSLMLSVLFLSTSTAQRGYDRTGYDGDFFSLEGALDVFKNSQSIKNFERRLNTRDSWVNNLDLNLDGQTDYIRVEHRRQGDYHAIILQVPINRREVQDVAVIEIERTGRRRATLQIVGDESLYGEQVIVEPYEGDGYSSGRGGPNADYNFRRGYVNVYYWPSVRHILRRNYNPWFSPYRYSYYPTWWSPWRPSPWDVFCPNIVIYNRNFQIVYTHRLRNVYNFYRPYRAYCPSVYQRTNVVRVNRRNRQVNTSFSRVRNSQRSRVAQANTPNVRNKRANQTGRRATSPANPSRSAAGQNRANSRVDNNQRVERSNSRANAGTRANSRTRSNRSNSNINSQASNRTNRSTINKRTNTRSNATSSSRSNRNRSAVTSPSRSNSRATSRTNSRSNRTSSAKSSRSAQRSSSSSRSSTSRGKKRN